MPKKDFQLKPGERLPENLADLIGKHLGASTVEKLLRHGGLVRLSVASPYVDRNNPKRKEAALDEAFMATLQRAGSDTAALAEVLANLPVKKLRELAQKLALPVRSKESAENLRGAIASHLRSGIVWKGIANA